MSDTLRAQMIARLQELADLGVDGLPRVNVLGGPAARPASGPGDVAEPAGKAPAEAQAPSSARPVVAAAAGDGLNLDLTGLRAFLADCARCKLCEGRTQVVFGVGNPSARLMFVGEAPGRDEDLQGEPFVGRAGQLLTDMIEKGMGLNRGDVYIANVVKCRPPENRNPEPDEVAACSPYLRRQVALVNPEVIVGLGKFAVQTLLQVTTPISQLRGKWHEYEGIPLMPTFHPAYLLRSPGEKRRAWEDLQAVMKRMGLGRA